MTASKPAPAANRQAFYDRLAPHDLAPLWEVLHDLVPAHPKPSTVPHAWIYKAIRPLLLESGDLLTAEEAIRRVLVMENPALPGQARITNTLYAGLQLIMPGETAPSHRHTQSALRFVLEGEGGFTTVGGERTTMRRGDFIITPNWAYHDHGHEGDGPVVWLDGLDLPLIGYLETGFANNGDSKRQELVRPEGDALARFGSGLLPMDAASPYGATSPIFSYPYEQSRAALLKAVEGGAADPHHGTRLRYANPIDGGWAMPTISSWLTHLATGFETRPVRSTDGQVVVVVEGAVEATIGGKTLSLAPSDVAVVPNWTWRSFKASEESILFCFSDRTVQEKLSQWREDAAA